MAEDLASAWLKEVRDLNAAADEAQARVLEYDRTHDAFHHVVHSAVAVPRPRASSLISRRAQAARQPRDARGRWVGILRWTHGTLPSYAWGKCRCRECVAVWNAYFAAKMRARYVPKGRAA